MSKSLMNRREFVGLATTAALGVTAKGAVREVAGSESLPDALSEIPKRRFGTDTEMAMAANWARAFSAAGDGAHLSATTRLFPQILRPPFSFVYDGKSSVDLLPKWNLETKHSDAAETPQAFEVTYTDPESKLQLRIVGKIFEDFPAVEWVLHFKNNGAEDTAILENVQALDCTLECAEGDPTIHHAKGATCSMDDFKPLTRVLSYNGRLHLQPGGGRSSSEFLPFFNIEGKGEGVVVAIGWTGEWAAHFSHPVEGKTFAMQAGMALTHLRLHPGEEIRSPRILTLFWQGGCRRGNNLLRQHLRTHHQPTAGGKAVQCPVTIPNWGETAAADHLENIRQIVSHGLPMDYYWIDAGWFGRGKWWKNAGDWRVKRDVYPDGFKPISDLLHASGRKLLLWFEPERVCAGTPWYTEHAEWLMDVPNERRVFRGFGGTGDWDVAMTDPRWVPNESARNQFRDGDKLFNLAVPEAREFLTDFISAKINEFGLDCFRNDANIAPLEFWRAADSPDRQGMTEIRWVEGFYAFWDELRRRHPNLIIDDCASGGRRIDLETISRSMPLSRTDFVRNSLADQCHTHGLLQWVPYNSTISGMVSTHSEYEVRSAMTAGLCYTVFFSGDHAQPKVDYASIPYGAIKKTVEEYRSIQKFYAGDFYPLTEYTQTDDSWLAYQLHLADNNEGVVVVLKRPMSSITESVFPLQGLDPGEIYEITSLDSDDWKAMTGKELGEKGLTARLLQKPDSAVYRYKLKQG